MIGDEADCSSQLRDIFADGGAPERATAMRQRLPSRFVVGLRAATSADGMIADFYPFDMTFLGATATCIVNAVTGVNRAVYDVTSKPPGTIAWE